MNFVDVVQVKTRLELGLGKVRLVKCRQCHAVLPLTEGIDVHIVEWGLIFIDLSYATFEFTLEKSHTTVVSVTRNFV